jgi:hypothetical protein
MAFLYPAFLIGALAIAVPVVLHLLRRGVAPEVPFSAVRLLRRSPVERTRRRRLRDFLLLAARVAAILLLAAAFARPYVPAASAPPLRIIALDRSFSMSAPGRFERALELARAAANDAAGGQRVSAIAFDERADLLAEPGLAADAAAALGQVQTAFGATRYRAAVERALEVAAGAPAQLMLITDLSRSGWQEDSPVVVPGDWTIDVRDVGEVAGNVAIESLRREDGRIVATVRNTRPQAYSGEVRVEVDGVRSGQERVAIPAGAVIDVPVRVRVPDTGVLRAAIDDPEGFPADNVRYLALDPAARRRVLVVTAGGRGRPAGFFLARALETEEGMADGFVPTSVPGSRLAAIAADEMHAFSAIALLSTRGLDRRGRDAIGAYVKAGGGLFVAAAPDVDAALLSNALGWDPPIAPVATEDGALTFAPTDLRHPIFRPFGPLAANLGQVRFERAWRVRPDGWEVAARFANGMPALLERAEGRDGRVVLFASDLDRRWNDFPLHPSFVPFAIESVRHVAGALRMASAFTPATAPAGAGPHPGVFRLGPDRVVTVNVDPRESGTDRMTPSRFREMMEMGPSSRPVAQTSRARQTEAGQGYWRYGLLLMLAALVVESMVGRK